MYAFFDVETVGLYGSFLCGGVLYDNEVFISTRLEEYKAKLKDLLSKGYILVGHNIMYDFTVLDFKPDNYKQFEDTFLLARVIQGLLKTDKFGLQELVETFTPFRYTVAKQHMQRLLSRGVTTFDLKKYLTEDLRATESLFNFLLSKYPYAFKNKAYITDKAFMLHLIDIQKRGLPFSVTEAQREYEKSNLIVQQTAVGFYKKYGVNINSPVQIRKKFKIESTEKATLMNYMIEGKDPELKMIAETLLQYKKLKKKTEFLERFIKKAKAEGRIYGKFNPCGAISGRLSCSDENLMQIPRDLRKFFKTYGYFLIFDFSQIELRLAGQLWKEPIFIRAFSNKEDLHMLTAQVLFKKSDITKEERFVGKTFNFAMLYGASEFTLRTLLVEAGLNYPIEIVQEFRENWLNTYSTIKSVHYETYKILKEKKYIVVNTVLNRRIETNKFNEALNIPIQGTGAELLKGVVIKFLRKCPEAKIVNLVHDEIQIECSTRDEAQEYLRILEHCLQEAWHNLFPEALLPVEGEGVITKTLEKG